MINQETTVEILSPSQRLSAVASLGDPVRKQLFELLREREDAVSRDECAVILNLPKSTIRAHLDRLVEQKLLAVEFRKVGERTGPGSGRPAKLYKVVIDEVEASVPARHYDLAAELLAAAIQHSIDSGIGAQDALSEVAFDAGVKLGAEAGSIEAVLENTGYFPLPDGEGGTIMANCPFHRLSKDHTGVVCKLNGSLLTGVLEGCDDSSNSIEPDTNLSHCCARIVPKQPS
ncbi:helix-turn-helix transcriptional regulator [Arthrobacter cryoconiti]|uniref:Helix-turn-helix transcriptional regulator n=1 Tax=Arthrobacter cryoconiti TaxID=748907 RepID=A0ABV8QYN9_9MICC|nr:ArsR family transcriptional regulator [Arthrobacter cryoconiti]MCC9068422.1 ArsR family transcriptional regulator [Arthrobacter cryoconiti]